MEPLIKLRNVVKIYKSETIRFRALQGVNLDVAKGEFVALVGKSGSGKSTLLHLAAGLERPTAGKIFVDGQAIHRLEEKDLVDFRRKKVGYVFQNFSLFETMTALENVMFPLMLKGISREKRRVKAQALLEQLELSLHSNHYPRQLSGGQQQRVAIARAIAVDPPILFADEPTGNLDSQSAQEIIELLSQLSKKRNTTLLLVTHDGEKAAYADRIVTIKDGNIEQNGRDSI